MKTIKFLLLFLVIICFSSCTQHLMDDKGIVNSVEYSYKKGFYNVYIRTLDRKFLCYGPMEISRKGFFFITKDSSYHVGDTVKFIVQ